MTPEELSLEAEKDIKDGVLPWQSKLKRHLLDFKGNYSAWVKQHQ